MKIQPTHPSFSDHLNKILEKDSDSSLKNFKKNSNDQASKNAEKNTSENHFTEKESSSPSSSLNESSNSELVSSQELSLALENFKKDIQNKIYGIQASLEGEGPGLKVVLKDKSGVFIRQLSGGEFIKIQTQIAITGLNCGKMLDQKL